jgi:hypothetical protein
MLTVSSMATARTVVAQDRPTIFGDRPILAALAYPLPLQLYELVWDHSTQRIPCDHERHDEIPMFTL